MRKIRLYENGTVVEFDDIDQLLEYQEKGKKPASSQIDENKNLDNRKENWIY